MNTGPVQEPLHNYFDVSIYPEVGKWSTGYTASWTIDGIYTP